MSSVNLGRRYERLLFASAPISLASLMVLFIALAATTQKEHAMALCYEKTAEVLDAQQGSLNTAWNESTIAAKKLSWQTNYESKINDLIIHTSGLSSLCFLTFIDERKQRLNAPPADIISKYKQDADALNKTPLVFSGMELPEKATISLLGTNIKIDLMPFTRMAQIILAPIILLWLGSLYNTRYRESILVGRSTNHFDNFPHLINMYPMLADLNLRKPSRFLYLMPKIILFVYACFRMALLVVFVAPPVIAYEWGLFLIGYDVYPTLTVIAGFLIGWFAMIILLVEIFPWNYNKKFPVSPS